VYKDEPHPDVLDARGRGPALSFQKLIKHLKPCKLILQVAMPARLKVDPLRETNFSKLS
jgi:hypothetical protein